MNRLLAILTASIIATMSSGANALTFNFIFTNGTSAEAQQAFIDAGANWSAALTDEVTIDMTVGIATLSAGQLVSAGSRRTSHTYSNVRSSLLADATSADDTQAVGSMPAGNSVAMLINRTADNPNGNGSATPYIDAIGANNTTVRLTTANAKALGLDPGTGVVGACSTVCDASIQFSNAFAFDFDPTDGITAGQFDFVGIATHEFGHALGFISGVDVLDVNSPPVNGPFTADQFTFVSTLDLFRFSVSSTASGVIDWTADTRAKHFSIDGGATVGPAFATGRNFGDAQQAGHWKDNLGLGLMDPTSGIGEELGFPSANDIRAFDVIGWDVTEVPEPTTSVLFGVGLAITALRRRRPL